MALPILTNADFTGFYKISTDRFTSQELTDYIGIYEEVFLLKLLGCDLKDLLLADLDVDNNPQTQRFIDIYEPFCIDDDCDKIRRSQGIKTMLKGFIYWHYVRDQKFNNTIAGQVEATHELSQPSSAFNLGQTLANRWNEAAETAQAIRWYICDYDRSSTYPEYNGKFIDFIGMGGAY